MRATKPDRYVESWYLKFISLDIDGQTEMIEHMKIEPINIITYSLFFKIMYYPLFWIRQYKITCKYWNKPAKNRWFWRLYYTTTWCNLLIWPKGGISIG